MKTEPTAIIEVIRGIALLASFAGVVITAEEQTVLAAGITAAGLAVSAGLAIWNRLSVFSKKSVDRIAANAARTGDPTVGDPPKGDVPAGGAG